LILDLLRIILYHPAITGSEGAVVGSATFHGGRFPLYKPGLRLKLTDPTAHDIPASDEWLSFILLPKNAGGVRRRSDAFVTQCSAS